VRQVGYLQGSYQDAGQKTKNLAVTSALVYDGHPVRTLAGTSAVLTGFSLFSSVHVSAGVLPYHRHSVV